MAHEAAFFVTRDMRILFGAIDTTKMHALSCQLLDEPTRRGNLGEAYTSGNEVLHKLTKVFYALSNKRATFSLAQMLRCEQTLAQVVAEDIEATSKAAAGLEPTPLVRAGATDNAAGHGGSSE